MPPAQGRRADRVGRVATDEVVRLRKAVDLRAEGYSFGDIAKELGYSGDGAAYNAVQRAITRSGFIPGLGYVWFGRFQTLGDQLEAKAIELDVDDHDESLALYDVAHTVDGLHLTLIQRGAGQNRPPGVRDVEGLLSERRPHVPGAHPDRDEIFLLRSLDQSLDGIAKRARLATRSGAHKLLEREHRRHLLEGVERLYYEDLVEMREAWHEIKLALRRRSPDSELVHHSVRRIERVLDRLGVTADGEFDARRPARDVGD